METLILEPEFFVDLDGTITDGPVVIHQGKVIAIGTVPHFINGKKIPLKNQVAMPGFVNCHSHVFQRVLRGLVEKKAIHKTQDNFWLWRKKMYDVANNITKEVFELIARLTYLEMLEAGFTHVGEFHYLHHDMDGNYFDDPIEMSKILALAARDTKINLCLLECAYNRYSFNQPLLPEQRRFAHKKVNDFLTTVSHAQKELKNTTVGIAIHSIRAVPKSWYEAIGDFARNHTMPLHIHVSEQPQEVRDCLKEYQCSPIELLNKYHLLTPHTTLIHATHLIRNDISILAQQLPLICVCPSTEKNLGDGMIPSEQLFQKDIKICIGTDQHVRLDPFGEILSLEEQERLRLHKRSVLLKNNTYLYENLLPCLHAHGLSSLYPTYNCNSLLNNYANLITVELPPEYHWHGAKVALDAIILAHNPSKITNVITNGELVVRNKQLHCEEKQYLIKDLRTFFHN